MAKLADVFSNQESMSVKKPQAKRITSIHYTKLITSAYQYRNRTSEHINNLAELLLADGKILEPVIVRKAGASMDEYEIISGHKRVLASKKLVEDGNDSFEFVPCLVEDLSDIRAEFAVYSTNGYDEKTPYEIMCEIEGMTRLLKEHPEEFPEFEGKGRLVEKLSSKLNISRSVISDYKNIAHNLGKEGMEKFKAGEIDKSAAVTLSSLPKKQQDKLLAQGLRKREEIKQAVKADKGINEVNPQNVPSKYRDIIMHEFISDYEQTKILDICKKDIRPSDAGQEILKIIGASRYEGNIKYDITSKRIGIEINWDNNHAIIPWRNIALWFQEELNECREDEQLEGQMDINDFPEYLPGESDEENYVFDQHDLKLERNYVSDKLFGRDNKIGKCPFCTSTVIQYISDHETRFCNCCGKRIVFK